MRVAWPRPQPQVHEALLGDLGREDAGAEWVVLHVVSVCDIGLPSPTSSPSALVLTRGRAASALRCAQVRVQKLCVELAALPQARGVGLPVSSCGSLTAHSLMQPPLRPPRAQCVDVHAGTAENMQLPPSPRLVWSSHAHVPEGCRRPCARCRNLGGGGKGKGLAFHTFTCDAELGLQVVLPKGGAQSTVTESQAVLEKAVQVCGTRATPLPPLGLFLPVSMWREALWPTMLSEPSTAH